MRYRFCFLNEFDQWLLEIKPIIWYLGRFDFDELEAVFLRQLTQQIVHCRTTRFGEFIVEDESGVWDGTVEIETLPVPIGLIICEEERWLQPLVTTLFDRLLNGIAYFPHNLINH